ncbi:MAG: hypothetical protein M3308_08630 [Actinomycetota bacterium]|nr:hypothetical protein [Actinomycetota bacterium]
MVENEFAVIAWTKLNPPLWLTRSRVVRLAPIQVCRPYDLDAATRDTLRELTPWRTETFMTDLDDHIYDALIG